MESLDGKEGLHLGLLRRHLLAHDFDFEVRHKGKMGGVGKPINKPVVHRFSDPEPF